METKFKSAELRPEKNKITAIFTKQIEDRDGETIKISGINIDNFLKNPVILDTHDSSTVLNILGTAKNVRQDRDVDNVETLIADIEFAEHPKAQYAESMVRKGELNTLSIGFRVMEDGYDLKTQTITKSELYEVSFVPLPANPQARVISKQAKFHELTSKIDQIENRDEIYKKLLMADKYKSILKNYRELYMGKEFVEALKYEKTGDELLDLKNIHTLVLGLFENQEEPPAIVENQQVEVKTLSMDELRNLFNL